ncbi:MAG: hypothetical protein K6T83_02930 [Alicyclobacillus sp.]|nr:hypothetical protein [Alicyclobacillus sp.]
MKKSHLLMAAVPVLTGMFVGSFAAPTVSQASQAQPLIVNQQWNASWSYNPFSATACIFPFETVPLAYYLRPNSQWKPELATSWQLENGKLIVHLRKDAKWSNNKPVTSQDIVDTVLLGGAINAGAWGWNSYITGVKAVDAHTVEFDLVKGVSAEQVEMWYLPIASFVSASEYGKFVVPNLQEAIVNNDTKVLNQVKQNVLNYNPSTYIGDGAFKLVHQTTNAAILQKSNTFWDAKNVHVPEIYLTNNPTGIFESGKVDYYTGAPPVQSVQLWLRRPNHKVNPVWDFSEFAIYFNTKKAPYNKVQVRQALAYIMNRADVTSAMTSGQMWNYPTDYPTGLQQVIEHEYLTKSDLKSLNPYKPNAAKAAKLLESVGFKKSNGQWLLPNGQPWTINISMPPWSDVELSMQAFQAELQSFGINCNLTVQEETTFWTAQHEGNFDISWGWAGDQDMNPIGEFYDLLVGQNYTPNQKGYIGMGFGPNVNVPGIGNVNLAKYLTNATQKVSDPKQVHKIVLGFAKLVDQQLPYIAYDNKRLQIYYRTETYTDWPPASSNLWLQAGGNADQALNMMIIGGYIRPVSN